MPELVSLLPELPLPSAIGTESDGEVVFLPPQEKRSRARRVRPNRRILGIYAFKSDRKAMP